MTGIAGVNASEVGDAHKKVDNTDYVQKINNEVNNSNISKHSARTQKKADEIGFKKSKKHKKTFKTNKKAIKEEKPKRVFYSKITNKTENIEKSAETDKETIENSTNSGNIQNQNKIQFNSCNKNTTKSNIQADPYIEKENSNRSDLVNENSENCNQAVTYVNENSNDSQLTDYLEQFNENDKALIGTNVSNDEPMAAGGVTTASLQSYLVQTRYCEVTSQTIKNTAATLTKGKTSTYAKAVAIFNYVRDRTSYSFYYNTKKGALGTLTSKSANCCDHTHLLIALLRAAGIPAKYVYVSARFTSGNVYGHVYANVWVDGKWYSADATSNSNTFGVIKNWNIKTCTLKGTYASLPF